MKSCAEERLELGEAYMFCEQCGSKLFSFDGQEDKSIPCPYWQHGRCNLEKDDCYGMPY